MPNPTDTARALVERFEMYLTSAIYLPSNSNKRDVADARAALLAHVAGVDEKLATLEAWLRDGHDENLSDRWICTPNGSAGPVVARGYEVEDIERPNLSLLADALATRPTEARDDG